MNEHTVIGSLLVLLPALFHGIERAYVKGKATDPNGLKPSWKTMEFWLKVGSAIVGALEVFNGTTS